jgi:hypothetical protein
MRLIRIKPVEGPRKCVRRMPQAQVFPDLILTECRCCRGRCGAHRQCDESDGPDPGSRECKCPGRQRRDGIFFAVRALSAASPLALGEVQIITNGGLPKLQRRVLDARMTSCK